MSLQTPMKVQVQDLGKLRREVQIEIPFDDIRGEYQQVKDQLRNTRLRGFRPGKFPKGWMKSRFRSSMATRSVNGYFLSSTQELFNQRI